MKSSQATVGAPIAESCTIDVTIATGAGAESDGPDGGGAATLQGSIRRIDETNTAPKATWLAQGMPQWPSTEQNQAIFAASIMQKEKLPVVKNAAGVLSFSVRVAANSVAAVQIPLGGATDVIAAGLARDRKTALAAAEARLAGATAEIAELKALLA